MAWYGPVAMAQEVETASILSRLKREPVERNVFVRVDILEEDLNEFERMLYPQQNESPCQRGIGRQRSMVGKAASRLEQIA